MSHKPRQSGFSLIETLLAVGTLAIGMVFVAGTLMTGIYFAGVSTERTIANVVADEAVAKIALRGLDPTNAGLTTGGTLALTDFDYPSSSNGASPAYSWSAVCRRENADGRLVEFTIFVSRLVGMNGQYWVCGPNGRLMPTSPSSRPHPILVDVVPLTGTSATVLSITDVSEITFLDSGFTIVDNATGQIYRVLDRTANQVTINPPWLGAATTASVWVVPRPVAGGRNPLVAVYQKVIRF
jgi:type II secretory pathway pseudopilin PulG